MEREARAQLRAALLQRYGWVGDNEWGPSSVEAGECDGCSAEARLVMTCGPGGVYLGRDCVQRLGAGAWCDGHSEDAAAALAWVRPLPPEADTVARLWWVATGEVKLDPELVVRYLGALPTGTTESPAIFWQSIGG